MSEDKTEFTNHKQKSVQPIKELSEMDTEFDEVMKDDDDGHRIPTSRRNPLLVPKQSDKEKENFIKNAGSETVKRELVQLKENLAFLQMGIMFIAIVFFAINGKQTLDFIRSEDFKSYIDLFLYMSETGFSFVLVLFAFLAHNGYISKHPEEFKKHRKDFKEKTTSWLQK